jgi:hypothetical protein
VEKLSDKEAALLAAARREAAARRTGSAAGATLSGADAALGPPAEAKLRPGPAERLALLMAEERAETERRKKKMRRYGIIIPGATVAIFALWVLRSSSRRR